LPSVKGPSASHGELQLSCVGGALRRSRRTAFRARCTSPPHSPALNPGRGPERIISAVAASSVTCRWRRVAFVARRCALRLLIRSQPRSGDGVATGEGARRLGRSPPRRGRPMPPDGLTEGGLSLVSWAMGANHCLRRLRRPRALPPRAPWRRRGAPPLCPGRQRLPPPAPSWTCVSWCWSSSP
jgi:hypothetical protein